MHPERASSVLLRSALTAPEPTLAVLFDPALVSERKQVVCDLLSPPAGFLLYSCCFVFFFDDFAPTFMKNLFWDARPLGSGLGRLAACTAGSPDRKLEETGTGTSREVRWDLGGAMFSGLHRGSAPPPPPFSQVTTSSPPVQPSSVK